MNILLKVAVADDRNWSNILPNGLLNNGGKFAPQFATIPKTGNWDTLCSTILAILKDDKYPQEVYFFGWLKVALEALYNGQHRFGQAMVLAGKAGCGKSLIQNIITELLSGRSAKPYQFMTGETAFNADLFGAEHLMIEDEAPDTSFKARKKFGTALKQFTVNRTQRLHAKGRDAVSLKPFWRLTISLINSHLSDCLPGEFTALSLEKLLRKRVDRYLIDRLFNFGRACGTYLGKLAHSHPERVVSKRTSDSRKWLITPL